MLMRKVSSKDRIPNGLLRTAAASGAAVALAAASLGGIGTASGTCIGISGIDIGDGCTTTFGNYALGLGDGTVATATNGFINGAIAIGTNINAIAGTRPLDFLNFAFNSGNATDGATSTVTAGGLAASTSRPILAATPTPVAALDSQTWTSPRETALGTSHSMLSATGTQFVQETAPSTSR